MSVLMMKKRSLLLVRVRLVGLMVEVDYAVVQLLCDLKMAAELVVEHVVQ